MHQRGWTLTHLRKGKMEGADLGGGALREGVMAVRISTKATIKNNMVLNPKEDWGWWWCTCPDLIDSSCSCSWLWCFPPSFIEASERFRCSIMCVGPGRRGEEIFWASGSTMCGLGALKWGFSLWCSAWGYYLLEGKSPSMRVFFAFFSPYSALGMTFSGAYYSSTSWSAIGLVL